jgi:asparaginyl-tRNA synthetase
VNDGSAVSNLQAVVNTDVEGYNEVEAGRVTTGASVSIEGVLVESQGSKQKVELQASKLLLV